MAKMTKQTMGKGLTVHQLIVRKLNRNILDVGQWRTALKNADNGKRQKLYELYEDVLLDTVLSSAIEKRIFAITNSELRFMRDEKPVPEMDDLIDSPVMEEILTEIMNARFWGKTVLELDFVEGFRAYNIPRTHLRPELGLITINPGDDHGIPYRKDDFFIEAGDDKDFGRLLKVAPFVIYKRGGFGDWAQFAEIFGIPFKKGKYSAQDEKSRETLQQALEESGSAPWIVIPKETDVEVVETSTRGNGELFNALRKACNEEILIGILGQTMTTVNGSSRSQSETHKEVEESTNKADRRFVQRILNTELLPRLEKRGFPVKGGWFTFPDAGESLSSKEQIGIHDVFINKLGLPIDEDFLYDFYGVPKPAGGKKEKPAEPDPEKKKKKDKSPESKGEEDNSRDKSKSSLVEDLIDKLRSFFVSAPGQGAFRSNGELPTLSDFASLPEFDIDSLLSAVRKNEAYFSPELFRFTADFLIKGLHAGFTEQNFASPGIEYGYTPDAYKTAMEMNLFRFSAAKTLAEIQELNEAFRASAGWADFYNRAKEISGKFNKNWLEAEYHTAYLTAESSATYYRLLAKQDIFPYWQYITVDDSKVRPEHQLLHKLILPVSDPLWKKIYPPNGWRCRCRVKPLMKSQVEGVDFKAERAKVEEFFKTREWKNAEAQGWGVNRALTAEVFNANQHYIRKFPFRAASYLDTLVASKWGLDTVPKLKAAAATTAPVTKDTEKAVWAAESQGKVITLKLYDGRSVELTQQVFNAVTAKTDNRISHWSSLKETLLAPDEVWINSGLSGSRYNSYTLLKYYKDKVIVANYQVKDGRLQLDAWHELPTTKAGNRKVDLEKSWNQIRRGLLIQWDPSKK